jgi:hypothetical protein
LEKGIAVSGIGIDVLLLRLIQFGSVPYSVLCKTFENCENTTKRLEITEFLVTLFVKVIELTPDGLLELLYMCINKVYLFLYAVVAVMISHSTVYHIALS